MNNLEMNPSARCYDGHSQVMITGTFETHSATLVHASAVSPDGNLLALGDDAGVLEIREYHPRGWRRVRLYGGIGKIRAMSWSPSQPRTLYIGSEKGNVQRITVALDLSQQDLICHGIVEGFVHALAVNRSGRLVIAYGHYVGVVNHPFEEDSTHLSGIVALMLEMVQQGGAVRDLPHIRNLHFLDEETILITYANSNGIHAYSIQTWQKLWSMEMRSPLSRIGSSALSPTGERMAVANLSDGVDWYSTSHQKYAMTTQFAVTDSQGRNPIVGIVFVDDDTVAVGHANGIVVFASYGFLRGGEGLLCASPGSGTAIRTLAFSYVAGSPFVFAIGKGPTATEKPLVYCAQIHRNRLVVPNATNYTSGRRIGFWSFMSIMSLALASGYAFFGLHGSPSTSSYGASYLALVGDSTSTLVHTTTVTRPGLTIVHTKTAAAAARTYTMTPLASTVTFTETSCADMTYAPVASITTYTKTDYATQTKTVYGESGANAMQCVCTFSGSLQAIPGVQAEITIAEESSDVD